MRVERNIGGGGYTLVGGRGVFFDSIGQNQIALVWFNAPRHFQTFSHRLLNSHAYVQRLQTNPANFVIPSVTFFLGGGQCKM